MGMTMTQKILAAHAGLESVKAGQLIMADLDLVLGNDITSPVAINEFEKNGFNGVFDKDKIAIVLDHFTPCKDINAAGGGVVGKQNGHCHSDRNDVAHYVQNRILRQRLKIGKNNFVSKSKRWSWKDYNNSKFRDNFSKKR